MRIADRCHVLRQLGHHERVAPEVRQVDELLPVEHLALRRRGGLDQRNLFGHLDAVADLANFELEVERDELLRGDNHVLPFDPFEAGGLRDYRIGGGYDLAEAVTTLPRCHSRALHSGSFIHEHDLSGGYRPTPGVENHAANAAEIRL
jgi:hypothetical protein